MEEKKDPKKKRRGGTGKKKIPIEFVKERERRKSIFRKRARGFIKKAEELSILSNCRICAWVRENPKDGGRWSKKFKSKNLSIDYVAKEFGQGDMSPEAARLGEEMLRDSAKLRMRKLQQNSQRMQRNNVPAYRSVQPYTYQPGQIRLPTLTTPQLRPPRAVVPVRLPPIQAMNQNQGTGIILKPIKNLKALKGKVKVKKEKK